MTCALSDIGIMNVEICDFTDFEEVVLSHVPHWDFIDENEYERRRNEAPHIKAYVSDNAYGERLCADVLNALSGEKSVVSVETERVNDEDWENNWKQYYKPFELGERFLIKPEWEPPQKTDRLVLNLDPGRLFGTGLHQTTQLCLCALERHVEKGCAVLDLGCGSGILAIGARLLGAGTAVCVDIDQNAEETVAQNAALNCMDDIVVVVGDAVKDGDVFAGISARKYDVIVANIVADVIIRLAEIIPKLLCGNGVFIASGIISQRADEVIRALSDNNMRVTETAQKDDWLQITAKIMKNCSDG